jgi:FtsH-binding integral membrane protein
MNSFNNGGNNNNTATVTSDAAKTFITQVFSWMFAALLITAGLAYAIGNSSLMDMVFNPLTHKFTPVFWIATLSPLAIILVMNFGYQRLSTAAMIALFGLYAGLMGVSMSVIFFAFPPLLIVKAFGISAGTFGVMAVMGYITKADLSRFGSILIMLLFGIIITSVINIFIGSAQLDWIIDLVCLFVFTGLVAFKMQMIKNYANQYGTSEPKMAVWMALSMYITFINLFMTILRLMSRR